MYIPSLILLLLPKVFCSQKHEQLYFPDDNGGLITLRRGDNNNIRLPSNINLTEIRGTSQYEKYVDQLIAGGIAKLTVAMNKALLRERSDDRSNIVFAPLSIAGALALVLLGSNGKTFDEITTVMGLTTGVEIQTRSVQVHEQFGRIIAQLQKTPGLGIGQQAQFASAVFVQNSYPIRNLYRQTAQDLYESEILNVDFQSNPRKAQQVINAWVSDRTHGKIKDILADVPSGYTKLIIASAMYFKAEWEYPFFAGTTSTKPFFANGRKSPSTTLVEMMANGGDFPYYRDSSIQCEVMGFPYKGNASVMYVVIPFNSNTQVLKELVRTLTAGDLEYLADNTVYTRAVVLFPKMKIESTTDLKASLELLGVKTLFNPALANLALLSPGEDGTSVFQTKSAINPLSPPTANPDDDSVLIFTRTGGTVNCTSIFDPSSSVNTCQDAVDNRKISYKKFGNKVGRRIARRVTMRDAQTIDNLRQLINQQSTDNNYQNPGLYAEKIIHKVYMDITETGTEAAAATSVSLSRDGSRVTFRVDVPFLFFIRDEQTKTILFWGSINTPTPNFK